MPSSPPASEMTMLSISNWLVMRPRDAPSAMRVTTSRPRAAPRASRRLATFEQASSTSSDVPASSTHSGPFHRPPHVRSAARGGRHVEVGREKGSELLGRRSRKALQLPVGLEHRLEPGLESGLGRLRRHARLQPAEHVHPPCAAIEQTVPARRHLPLHHRRHPQRRRFADVHSAEAWRRDADHRHRLVVDQDLAPDDVRGAAEAVGPVVVRDRRRPDARRAADRPIRSIRRPRCGRTPSTGKYVPDTISASTG